VGKTGRATGPHLHLEVRIGDRPVEPQRMLNEMFGHADN
jgi:murein DD-endopeptidase MepM/ murein hydrolase activator NlpD